LVASALLSHNLIVPVFGVIDEKKKVKVARIGVLTFGVIAYFLAREAGGVFELVETASAFGSAGVLVTVSFALFTRRGGPKTAMATLVVGILSYMGAGMFEYPYPFLASLFASLMTYVLGSAMEAGGRRLL
jgi:Na+/proline symporter